MAHPQSDMLIKIVFEIWGYAIHADDLHELAVEIRRPLSKIMDTTNFGICLYNPERDALTMLYRVDEMDAVDNYEHYYLEQVSQSDLLLGEVIRTNRALLIHKDEDLRQASRTGKKIVGTPAEVWLGVPMKMKGQIQSIIILQSYHDSALYGLREKEMLEVLSEPIAAALEYKKMEEAQSRDEAIKRTLFNIASAVNLTHDLNDLYRSIHQALKQVIDLPNFFIGFYDKQKGVIDFPYLVDEFDFPQIGQTTIQAQSENKYSLSMQVIETGKALRLNKEKILKTLQETGKTLVGTVPEIWLGFPLKTRNEVIGIMGTQSYTDPFHFTEKEIEVMGSVGDQIAIAIDRKRAEEEARKRAERLTVINRIGRLSATADTLDQLLQAIYEEINGIFKPDAFSISFFDQKTNELEFRLLIEENKRQPSLRVPLKSGFSSKVILDQKPLVIRDYEREKQNLPPGLLLGNQKHALSWIGVPLKYQDQVIGLVNIQSYQPHTWNDEDIQLFFTIADQLAGMLEKARLFEEARIRAERLTVINRIGKAAATADNLDQLMTAIHEEIEATFKPDAFFIAFFDQKTDELEFRFHINKTDGKLPIMRRPLGNGFCAKVIQECKPLIIKNYEKENELLPRQIVFGDQKPAISWVGVPLMLENQIMGVASIQSYAAYAWNDEDIQLFFTITDQIAGSIEKARLFEEARARAERLTVINRIGRVAETVDNLDKLMEAIYQEIRLIFKPGTFFIAFLDRKTDELETRFLIENEERLPVARYPLGNGLSSKVIMEKKPLIIHHYDQEQDHLPKQILFGDFIPSQSWIGVPLKFEDQIVGLVNIQTQRSNAWNDEDIQLFFTIADQIAGSIAKALLFEEAQKRLERLAVLNRIGVLAASALNIEQLLNDLYEEINAIFKPHSFFIAFYIENSNELEFKFLMDEGQKSEEQRVPLGNGLSSKVIAEKRPLVVNHYDNEKSNLPAQMTSRKAGPGASQSWIGVPLMFDGQLIGIVNIQSHAPNAWNQEDQQLFFTIADQIGAIIQKARLYESLQLELSERKKAEEEARRRAERLTIINRIGNLPATATNLDQLLANIYEEINAVFKPMIFFIAFYHTDIEELEFRFLIRKGEKRENLRLPLGQGLSAKVIKEKKALIINNYEKEKEHLPQQMVLPNGEIAKSWIGVPLIFEDQVIGIASMQAFEPDVWNEEDQEFFFTITDQITGSIAKARLYEAVQQELSERKKAEEENKKLESQLRQAQKMEAIGTLAGGIAHDFNNVLYPIIGFTEMTMDLVPEESLAKKNLDEILIAADRAKSLVQQILTFSRQQEYNPQPLRVQPILKETLKLIRSSMPTTISLIQEIEETCGPVLSDPSQIHQIIMNLCTNAYHAMKTQGGVLEVKLSEIDIAPGQSEKYGQLYPGLYVRLTVRDTGHGIDPLILERIFEPYFTTKPPGEGTGLGLALVHGIVKSFGGEIRVTSQSGQGTMFQIFLPRVMENEPETALNLLKCVPGQREIILVVDDEKQILDMIELMLNSLNYTVVTKMDSIEALEEFRKNPAFFDLVLTDQTMPGLIGFELSKKILAIRKETPIILCTGFSELVNEELVKSAGIRKFILKPISKSQLALYLREILDADKIGR